MNYEATKVIHRVRRRLFALATLPVGTRIDCEVFCVHAGDIGVSRQAGPRVWKGPTSEDFYVSWEGGGGGAASNFCRGQIRLVIPHFATFPIPLVVT